MVSVIIPTYNRAKLIKRAIQSVLNQTYKEVEIIVIDDGSTDNTEQIINNFSCRNLKYIKLEKNCGACKARNVGIANASGEFISFLDSDDEWDPYKLEYQLNFLKQKNASVVVCNYYYIKNNNKILRISSKHNDIITYNELLYENCITTGAILATKSVFEENNFDLKMPRYQDWDIVLRISQKNVIYFLNIPLLFQYFQDNSITNVTSKLKKYYALERIFLKNEKQFYKNKQALAHIYWSMGMYSLYLENTKIDYLKKGLILDKNIFKRLLIYIFIRFGLKKTIMKLYEKEH